MTENAIEIKSLRKSFGKKEVLKGIDLTVKKGQIVAILGPNGAGKTTTINILSTLMKSDSGDIKVNGHDVNTAPGEVRSSIGLTGQFAAVDEYLTGEENLNLVGGLYHMKKSEYEPITKRLIEDFDLVESSKTPVKSYSGGMKRKIDLAMSLIASPPIIFLDEPTTGLDPRSRNTMWELIKKLAKDGTTILLTTQYMDEADKLADHIIVIDNGVVISEGTALQLKSQVGDDRVDIVLGADGDFDSALKLLENESATTNLEENTISISAKKGVKKLQTILGILEKTDLDVETVTLRKPTLDDVFLSLTGHVAEEEAEEEPKKKSKGKK